MDRCNTVWTGGASATYSDRSGFGAVLSSETTPLLDVYRVSWDLGAGKGPDIQCKEEQDAQYHHELAEKMLTVWLDNAKPHEILGTEQRLHGIPPIQWTLLGL